MKEKKKENRTEERERRETKAKQRTKNTGERQTNADSGGLKESGWPTDQVSRVSTLPVFAFCMLRDWHCAFLVAFVTVQVKFNSLEQ